MKYSILIDKEHHKCLVGTLDIDSASTLNKYTFTYSDEWIATGFPMENALPLTRLPYISMDIPLFLQDASPNSWGKSILSRNQSSLEDIDCLLAVNDYLRMGGLQICEEGSIVKYLGSYSSIPTIADLQELKEASSRMERILSTEEDMTLLLNAGTAMGGARPKVTVMDGNDLYMAKFQTQSDYFRVACWEATVLKLSMMAGFETNDFKIVDQGLPDPILLVKRFDRNKEQRIHFASMLSLGCFHNIQKASYAEIGDNVCRLSCEPEKDVFIWWKRMVFNGMIGNTDDHLRNHGFLRHANGWRLSPVYDINPVPFSYKARSHILSFMPDDTHKASIESFNEVGRYFKISKEKMETGYQKISAALKQWKSVAKDYGSTETEIKYFEKAFEHEDSQKLMAMAPKTFPNVSHKNGM